jgi:hypothetical protein
MCTVSKFKSLLLSELSRSPDRICMSKVWHSDHGRGHVQRMYDHLSFSYHVYGDLVYISKVLFSHTNDWTGFRDSEVSAIGDFGIYNIKTETFEKNIRVRGDHSSVPLSCIICVFDFIR